MLSHVVRMSRSEVRLKQGVKTLQIDEHKRIIEALVGKVVNSGEDLVQLLDSGPEQLEFDADTIAYPPEFERSEEIMQLEDEEIEQIFVEIEGKDKNIEGKDKEVEGKDKNIEGKDKEVKHPAISFPSRGLKRNISVVSSEGGISVQSESVEEIHQQYIRVPFSMQGKKGVKKAKAKGKAKSKAKAKAKGKDTDKGKGIEKITGKDKGKDKDIEQIKDKGKDKGKAKQNLQIKDKGIEQIKDKEKAGQFLGLQTTSRAGNSKGEEFRQAPGLPPGIGFPKIINK